MIAAQHDRDRKRDLYNMHAGSQADLETAEDNFGKAKAELDRAKQKAALLRAGTVDTVSQTYVLRSLIDGDVLMRNINPGMEVQGQYGGGTALELFTIGTLDPIWALADIYEVDLARVQAGAPIRLAVVTYPDKVFEGKVELDIGNARPGDSHGPGKMHAPEPGSFAQTGDVCDSFDNDFRKKGASG